MSKLFRTDKMIEEALSQPAGPSADTVFLVNQLGRFLAAISNQLDLLIQLECGLLPKATLKKKLQAVMDEAALMAQAAEVSAGGGTDPALD